MNWSASTWGTAVASGAWNSGTKVLTPASSPGWTVNALAGLNFEINGVLYTCASNTASDATMTASGSVGSGTYTWILFNLAPPVAGDTVHLNGAVVTQDAGALTVPASGSLLELTGKKVDGTSPNGCGLGITLSGSNAYVLNVTTITWGQHSGQSFIAVTGSAPSSSFTCTFTTATPGSGVTYGCFALNGTGTKTLNCGTFINPLTAAWGAGTVYINGNAAPGGTYGNPLTATGGTATITGNLTGGTNANGVCAALSQTAGTTTVTGNVVGGTGNPGVSISGGTLTINGNVTGGSGTNGWGTWGSGLWVNSGTPTITINGTATSGTTYPSAAVYNIASVNVTINGNLVSGGAGVVMGRYRFNPSTGNYSQHLLTSGSTFKQYREDAFVTASQVISGVTFWANGVSGTGTYVASGYPSTNDVRFGVVFGASSEYTGTVSIPAVGNVLQGVGFGYGGGTEFTGTYVVTAAADVQSGVAFGAAGAQTGTFAAPAQSDVRQGVGYGAASTEYTGSLGGGVVTLTAA